MKINITFLGYKEEDYISKKTGNQTVARELTCLTENSELLVFGYDSFGKTTDTESLKACTKGQTYVLHLELRPNKYNRNLPRLVILGASER